MPHSTACRYSLPRQVVGEGDLFALTVSGDSMIDAAICDGDVVTVRRQDSADHGDIVAALLDDEATGRCHVVGWVGV
jgi:repressor LexA